MFGNRVTDKWNNLPQCCINCTTLSNFKSHIHKVYWNRKLSKKSYNLDSERYMAKACASTYAVSVVALTASVNSVNC